MQIFLYNDEKKAEQLITEREMYGNRGVGGGEEGWEPGGGWGGGGGGMGTQGLACLKLKSRLGQICG